MQGQSTTSASSANHTDVKRPKLEISEKVKVLCLHGYRQSGDSFKSKLGSFRKQVSKYADLVFVTAPHFAPLLDQIDDSATNDKGSQQDQRCWWFNSEDGKSFKSTNRNAVAHGFEESLHCVEKVWEEQGPFQGLLGFSQGGCFAGLIAGLARRFFTKIRPKFVIISSGFLSGSLAHINYFDEPVLIPSLHIYGETDEIVTPAMCKALTGHFEHCEILTHPGGHYFPATAAQKQTYINFFQDRLQDYLEEKELERMKADGLLQFEVSEGSEDNVQEMDSDDS